MFNSLNEYVVPPVDTGGLSLSGSAVALSDIVRSSQSLKQVLLGRISTTDIAAASLIERIRPKALRPYDQIPMRAQDMLCQVKLIAPYLAGQSVAFIGDYDSTSLLIGLLSQERSIPSPAHMLLLDFDERLLVAVYELAVQLGLNNLLSVRPYNVFDRLPRDLIGQFDWFYTNPPYGSRNNGESARLFVARGLELAKSYNSGGCIILPDDPARRWTRAAMKTTKKFLTKYGWKVDEKFDLLHQYHLDDDRELTSSTVLVRAALSRENRGLCGGYFGRNVEHDEIPDFYGLTVKSPYPRYIRQDGKFAYN